jgi:hypothetical protein
VAIKGIVMSFAFYGRGGMVGDHFNVSAERLKKNLLCIKIFFQ